MTSTALPLDDTQDVFTEDAVCYLSGVADVASVARLEAALKADPAARRSFVALARLHGHLGEIGRRAAAGSLDSARLLAVGPTPVMPQSGPVVRRRRWLAPVAAVAAALLVASLTTIALAVAGVRSAPLVPTVSAVDGGVTCERDGVRSLLTPGMRLRVGDRIVIGSESTLSVALQGGRFTLAPGSDILIEAADETHRGILLNHGMVTAELGGTLPMAVRTPGGRISVADAAAQIRVTPSGTAVSVSRGQVEIVDRDGGTRQLSAGASWEATVGVRHAQKEVSQCLYTSVQEWVRGYMS